MRVHLPDHASVRARLGALAPALSLLLFAAAKAEDQPILVFSGNLVLNDEVYRAVIDLPSEAPASEPVERLVRARVLSFLGSAGYDLAKIDTTISDGQIHVHVDEGQLDKVIVFGQGAYKTLVVKLELALPYNVYNSRVLAR